MPVLNKEQDGFTITSFLPYASIFDKFVFKAGWQSGSFRIPPFRKRFHSTRLSGCKRNHNGSLSQLPFYISTRVQIHLPKTQIHLFRTPLTNQKSEPLSEGTEVRIFLVCSWYCRGMNSKRRMHDPWSIICSCVAQRSTT